MKLADNQGKDISHEQFEIRSVSLDSSHLPLKAKYKVIFSLVPGIVHCFHYFHWISLNLADNLVMHKVSDHFQMQPDQTLHFDVTCP